MCEGQLQCVHWAEVHTLHRVTRRLVIILPPLWELIHDCEVLTRIWYLEN